MADRDPLTGLTELARVGEDLAHPLPVEQVRRLGDRRRARRHAGMVAAAVAAVVIAGGTALSQGVLRHRPGTGSGADADRRCRPW